MVDVRNTTIEVDIVTPEGVEIQFSARDPQGDLLHVHTHNDLVEPCGTFQLTLSGRRINGLTWDELIPLRSEVTIRLQDPRDPVNRTASVVMRGLTDDHGVQERYSQREPQRVVTISGRSGAGLLLDARLFYHHALESDRSLGTLRLGEADYRLFWQTGGLLGYEMDPRRALGTILTYYLGLPTTVDVPARTEPTPTLAPPPPAPAQAPLTRVVPSETDALATQRLLEDMVARGVPLEEAKNTIAWARTIEATGGGELLKPLRPSAAQRRAQARMLALQSASQAQPAAPTPPQPRSTSNQLLNLELPGRRTVADLLVYREDQATLFTEGVTIFLGHDTPAAGALWNYMELFWDKLMQEMFTRIEGGTCRLHFRGKPFKKDFTGTGTRFVDTEPTLETIALPWGEVLTRQQRRQTSQIYNFFLVLPLGASLLKDNPAFRYHIVPAIARRGDDPNAVTRYGIRVLEHVSPYLSATRIMPESKSPSPLASNDMTIKAAIQWSEWASVWHGWGSEQYTGFVTLPGSPRYNCGHRLTWAESRGPREAYCEGIDHDWDARNGAYTSTLRYTRAWYLDGPVDRRKKATTNGAVSTVPGSGPAPADE